MSKIFTTSADFLNVNTAVVTAPAFTIHAWVKHAALGANENIVTLGTSASADNRYYLLKPAANTPQAIERDTTGANATAAAISDTNWHCYTGVFTSDSSRAIFVDGAGKATNSTVKTPSAPGVLYIGRSPSGSASAFTGRMAYVTIWNRALTDAEVALLADRSPTLVGSSSIVAYYPLLSDALDKYGSLNLTVNGAAGYDSADSPTFTWPFELLQHTQKATGSVASTTLAYARANIAASMGYCLVHQNAVQSCTVTDSAGNTWTLIDRQDGTSNSCQAFYAKNLIAGANTNTVTPAAACSLRIGLAEYSGPNASAPLDVSAKATGTGSTALSVGPVTPSKDHDLIVLGWSNDGANVLTAGTNYEIEEQIVTGTERAGFEQKLAGSATPETGTGTFASNATWLAVMAAFTNQAPGSQPAAGTLTIAGLAPTLYTERAVAPGVGAIGLVGQIPTFPFTTIVPIPALLAAQGLQPTVSVVTGPSGQPDVGGIIIQGLQISTERIRVIVPDINTSDADELGLEPTIIQGWLVAPSMVASPVNTVGLQPIIIAGGSVTVNPPVGFAQFLGLAPTSIIPAGQTGVALPAVGQVQLLGLAPGTPRSTISSPITGYLSIGSYAHTARNLSRWHPAPTTPSTAWHSP